MLTPDETRCLKSAHAVVVRAKRAADRVLQRAKADLLDADDAFVTLLEELGARHGFDPTQPMRLLDTGAVVRAEPPL